MSHIASEHDTHFKQALQRSRSFANEEELHGSEEFCVIFKNLLSHAMFLAMYFVIDDFINLNSLYFVGHLDDPELLAGWALGISFLHIIGFRLIESLNQGMNIIANQARGFGSLDLGVAYFHKALIINFVAFMVVSLIITYSYEIFLVCGFDQAISMVAHNYVRYLFPSLFFFAISNTIRNFLESQERFVPLLIIQLGTVAVHVFNCIFFIQIMELGIEGAAIARNVTYFVNCIVILIYVRWFETIDFQLKKMFQTMAEGWDTYFHGHPLIALGVYLDFFKLEGLFLVAGHLKSHTDVAAHSTMQHTTDLLFLCANGFAKGLGAFVSETMAAKEYYLTKKYIRIGLGVVCLISAFEITILIMFHKEWSEFFTHHEEVNEASYDIISIYICVNLADNLQPALEMILEAAGQIVLALSLNAMGLTITITLAITLAFGYGMGLKGVWIAYLIGQIVQTITSGFFVSIQDWKHDSNLLRKRLLDDATMFAVSVGINPNEIRELKRRKSMMVEEDRLEAERDAELAKHTGDGEAAKLIGGDTPPVHATESSSAPQADGTIKTETQSPNTGDAEPKKP